MKKRLSRLKATAQAGGCPASQRAGAGGSVEREIMLVKVQASGYGREEVKRNTEIFRGQIIDVTPSIYTVQSPAPAISWMHFCPLRDVARIVEVARSGVVGLSRGDKIMR